MKCDITFFYMKSQRYEVVKMFSTSNLVSEK